MKKCMLGLITLLLFGIVQPILALDLADVFYCSYKTPNGALTPTALTGTIIMQPDSEVAFVDGKQERSEKPYAESGRIFVPLRFIAESFGMQVNWQGAAQKIELANGEHTVLLQVGGNCLTVDGQILKLATPPVARGNRVYLPLRALGESLGKEVGYLEAENIVFVQDPANPVFYAPSNAFHTGSPYARLPMLCSLLCTNMLPDGFSVVYVDRGICIMQDNAGQLYLGDLAYDNDVVRWYQWCNLAELKQGTQQNSSYKWYHTKYGDFLCCYIFEDMGGYSCIYRIDGAKVVPLINSEEIRDIKFAANGIYVLLKYNQLPWKLGQATDGGSNSNLRHYSYSGEEMIKIGESGWIYGYDQELNFVGWELKDSSIEAFGFDAFTSYDADNEFGFYDVPLNDTEQKKLH